MHLHRALNITLWIYFPNEGDEFAEWPHVIAVNFYQSASKLVAYNFIQGKFMDIYQVMAKINVTLKCFKP